MKQLQLVFFIFFTFKSYLLHAQPSSEALKLIESAIDSTYIQVRSKSPVVFEDCSIQEYFIRGLDPITKTEREVRFKTYEKSRKPLPGIIILPPNRGVSPLDEGFARSFCKRNFRVVTVRGWDFEDEWSLDLKLHDRYNLRLLSATHDIIEVMRRLGSTKLGIMGMSGGAVNAALVLNIEPKILAGAIIMGGGDYPEMIARTSQNYLTALKKERFKKFKYKSLQEYIEALRNSLLIDNLDFAGYTGPKKIFMVMAMEDDVVPTLSQRKLKNVLQPEKVLIFHSGHIPAILSIYFDHHAETIDFFAQALNQQK